MDLNAQEGESASVAVRIPYIQCLTLSNFTVEYDRYGVSNRAAAALIKDVDINDRNGQTLVIDKNKVQRERNRCRNDVKSK